MTRPTPTDPVEVLASFPPRRLWSRLLAVEAKEV
jgi:hypothetical protein